MQPTRDSDMQAYIVQWLHYIRQIGFQPSNNTYVKKILRKCVSCTKLIGKPYKIPDPPPLPKLQVDWPNPFNATGVDFTGKMYICDNRR